MRVERCSNKLKRWLSAHLDEAHVTLLFNSYLAQLDIDPSGAVLLRHQDTRPGVLKTPYQLWRDDRAIFELYQSTQTIANRSRLAAAVWAAFVVTPDRQTLFAGLYNVRSCSLLKEDRPFVHAPGVDLAESCDDYSLQRDSRAIDMEGRLYINWGEGTRSWIQRAHLQNKPITKVSAEFHEPPYPGHLNFIQSLDNIPTLPSAWVEVLRNSQGVYLLTCPKTHEQYVGAAYSEGGFWQRWKHYVETGHGDNVALKSRDLVNYQVSILEVAGSNVSRDEVIAMESRWKEKLQSREMGLNRN